MEFSRILRSNARISLTEGVCVFRSHDKSLILKHNNKLSRISSSSDLDKISRILQILRRPRILGEILNMMYEFKRGDVIGVLQTLHQRNFITVREEKNKSISKRNELNVRYFMTGSIEKWESQLADSQIVLIGNGFLANRLAMMFKKMNVKISRIKSLTEAFRQKKENKKIKNLDSKKKGESESASLMSPSFTSSVNKSDLIIVVEDYQNISLFELINEICFEKKKAWIRMSFDDNIGYLGPIVIPGRTSCFNCCELRLVTNSPNYEFQLWRNRHHMPKTRLQVPKIFADILSVTCAKEVMKYLTHMEGAETMDNLILFDTSLVNFTKHKLIRHPNCIYCNSIGLKKKSHSKFFRGSFNANREMVLPEINFEVSIPISEHELLERLRKLIDERTGIIVDIEKLFIINRLGINSHNFFYANCYKPLRIGMGGELTKKVELDNNILNTSGSGLSPNQAEIHTLMEAVERYSNMVADESRFIWTTYRDVEKMSINPMDLCLYSNEMYALDKRISRFSSDSVIPWMKGQDLYSGKPVFVAADFVHYPSIREKPMVFDNSNGASAHTDLVLAILNGLYEVIERDSFLTMWLNKIPMPILDIRMLPNDINKTIRTINEYGMNVKLVDLTTDLFVPTVMAVCYNKNPRKYPVLEIGIATHVQPEMAVQKALLEMEIELLDHLEKGVERKITDPNKISSIYENAIYYSNPKRRKYWEFMISSNQTSKPSRFAGKAFNDQNVVLKQIVTHLHTRGHRVVYVDITPSDIRSLGLVAVKVFVTGLQPLYFGNESRFNLSRLQQSAEYVRSNIGSTKVDKELNTAPHPLS